MLHPCTLHTDPWHPHTPTSPCNCAQPLNASCPGVPYPALCPHTMLHGPCHAQVPLNPALCTLPHPALLSHAPAPHSHTPPCNPHPAPHATPSSRQFQIGCGKGQLIYSVPQPKVIPSRSLGIARHIVPTSRFSEFHTANFPAPGVVAFSAHRPVALTRFALGLDSAWPAGAFRKEKGSRGRGGP